MVWQMHKIPNPPAHPDQGALQGFQGVGSWHEDCGCLMPHSGPWCFVPRRWECRKTQPGAFPVRDTARLGSLTSAQCSACGAAEVGRLGRCFRAFNSMATTGAVGHCGNNQPGQECGSAEHQTLSSGKPNPRVQFCCKP